MGATGRKLTIRMPDNPRLRTAEVGTIHLDPGARVQSGYPVLTLLNRRKEHLVRAPRSGRIVPLIAAGDRVSGGDPLYILHVDEAALEEENREQRVMIAVEREKWTSGVLADAIEPLRREKEEPSGFDFSGLAREWGKPVLALALYVLACFALLPILHFFGNTASTPVLIAMVVGCIAFAALIYYLYAPDAGRWPKWTVRMVAISWVGISSLALFYRPDNPQDLTLDAATGPIASLFQKTPEPLAPAPKPAPPPVAVAQIKSGVAVGPSETRSQPTQSPPTSVLASFDQVIQPHDVQVREWGRVNPINESGTEITFTQADLVVQPGASIAVARADGTALDPVGIQDPFLSEALATPPQRAERQADIIMAAIPQVQDTTLPELNTQDQFVQGDDTVLSFATVAARGSSSAERLSSNALEAAPTDNPAFASADAMDRTAVAVLRGDLFAQTVQVQQFAAIQNRSGLASSSATRLAVSAQPRSVRTPAPNLSSQYRIADSGWIDDQSTAQNNTPTAPAAVIAIAEISPDVTRNATPLSAVQSLAPSLAQTSATPPAADGQIAFGVAVPGGSSAGVLDEVALDLTSTTPIVRRKPVRVASSRSPGLLLISAVRAGETTWMLDQTALLGTSQSRRATDQDKLISGQSPVILATLGNNPVSPEPRVNALQDQIGIAKVFGMAVLPVLDGEPTAPVAVADGYPGVKTASLAPVGSTNNPAFISDAIGPQTVPSAPPVQPELQIAQRDLLYLYFDDPRILSHPQLGDPWQGLTSPKLANAIQRTEVVAVHEMLQVQNWCAAANDPDGTKRAQLGQTYTTAFINDRIRLLRVRLSIDEVSLQRLESEIPLFDGTPAGFFHNKAPLLAGLPEDTLMQRGRDYLRSLSAGIFDPNAPDAIGGGQYFDNAIAVSVILQGAGCDQASLNDGAGATNAIGRTLESRLGG